MLDLQIRYPIQNYAQPLKKNMTNSQLIKAVAIGAIKATISLVPKFGPYLAEAFFEIPAYLAQQRQEELLKTVVTKLERVEEKFINLDYILSEDFSDLLQQILRKIILRKGKERADFFAKLAVANTLKTPPTTSVDWQFQFIEILSNLNDSEMRLLDALEKHRDPSNASVLGTNTPFGLLKSEFQLCFDSLISKGLVYDAGLSSIPRSAVGRNPSNREYIDISPLGKKLIQFTKEIDAIMDKAVLSTFG